MGADVVFVVVVVFQPLNKYLYCFYSAFFRHWCSPFLLEHWDFICMRIRMITEGNPSILSSKSKHWLSLLLVFVVVVDLCIVRKERKIRFLFFEMVPIDSKWYSIFKISLFWNGIHLMRFNSRCVRSTAQAFWWCI